MKPWFWLGLALYLASLFGYWCLLRAATRGDRQLRALLNQPRDRRGLRIMR